MDDANEVHIFRDAQNVLNINRGTAKKNVCCYLDDVNYKDLVKDISGELQFRKLTAITDDVGRIYDRFYNAEFVPGCLHKIKRV